jgi:chromosome segregation ATPase
MPLQKSPARDRAREGRRVRQLGADGAPESLRKELESFPEELESFPEELESFPEELESLRKELDSLPDEPSGLLALPQAPAGTALWWRA